jgi:hypothetical protein
MGLLGRVVRAISEDYQDYRGRPKERGYINAVKAAEAIAKARQDRDLASQEADLKREQMHLNQRAAARADETQGWEVLDKRTELAPDGFLGDPRQLDPAASRALAESARQKILDAQKEQALALARGKQEIEGYGSGGDAFANPAQQEGYQLKTGRINATRPGMDPNTYGPNWQARVDPVTRNVVGYENRVTGEFRDSTKPMPGGPTPFIAQGGRELIAARSSVLKLMGDTRASINQIDSSMGPLSGRLLKLKIGQLGGYGTTPAERQAAQRILTLLSARSFAEGGKNLTGTEKEILFAQLPDLNDTVEQALSKLEVAEDYLRKAQESSINMIPEVQRGQVGSGIEGAPKRRRVYNPTTGTFEDK